MVNMDFQVLHQVVNRPYPYVIPAIFLVIISIYAAFRSKAKKYNFPVYGIEEGDPDAHKKRWLGDSINLLREGCSKVHLLSQFLR